MLQDAAPQIDPAAVAAWLIQATPRAQALPPDERLQLHQQVAAIITHARGPLPKRAPAPTLRGW